METLMFIGKVNSDLKTLEQCPLLEHENAPPATIEIFGEFAQGIKDIIPGDRLILFTWLHQADRAVLITRPRNNLNAPLTGVFSTRSPDRPNPIGIHIVKVTSVLHDNRFVVEGLEVLDQTPIVDLKPYLNSPFQGV